MRIIIDFLENKNVEKTKIFGHLKCSKTEAMMLQNMAKKYVQGEDDVLVLEVLQELFDTDEYEHLNHLKEVKNLLELGWLH